MQYTTCTVQLCDQKRLCYQDFKDTFVCNTQQRTLEGTAWQGCVIRISKILLYAIHNSRYPHEHRLQVVLSGFQRYFCMQYTTVASNISRGLSCVIRISKILLYAIHNINEQRAHRLSVVLSGFQRYFCMQYTTVHLLALCCMRCVIRISKILLYAIHNYDYRHAW